MAYASAQDLRDRYTTELTDEFEGRSDAELNGYLEQAAEVIDRYRPSGDLDAGATRIFRNLNLTLGRAMAHDEQQLDELHPVIREYREAMNWLQDLSRGRVSLPGGSEAATGGTIAVGAPDTVFTSDTLGRMP